MYHVDGLCTFCCWNCYHQGWIYRNNHWKHLLIFSPDMETFFKWYRGVLAQCFCQKRLISVEAHTDFYTPVWKTGRIMPWQCPSVRPSVRPSIRPRFLDFSSTCFEISIWNLVYAFSRWHDMSSLSCITIGSIWLSLQPKVGQTYFLQSWPHKSR